VSVATRSTLAALASTLTVAVALILALAASGVASGREALASQSGPHGQDINVKPTDFRNLQSMTRVRGFFVDNRLGHLKQALRVANSPKGGVYPVGTIIQLIPQEAMVKRRKGYDPATRDWEFFTLQVTAQGTNILTSGTTSIVNRFGGSCLGCHSAATPRFDMVCEHDHGCAPLPIGDDLIAQIQRLDPRPIVEPTQP
jgi:hypothetical protein